MAVSQSLTLTETSVGTLNNTSKVRILWQSTQTGESWNGYTRTAKYYVSINGGAETEYSVSYTLPQNITTVIVDKTITVTHKADGTGTVKVRTWMDTDISAGVVEKTKSITLTTIPAAATIDALTCSTSYFTGTMTYKYTPKYQMFFIRCNISLNIDGAYTAVKSIDLGQQSSSQKEAIVTLSEDELSIIYNKLTSTTKGTLRFTIRTYVDVAYTDQVGSAGYKEIVLSIPDVSATKPTVAMTLAPVSDFTSAEAIYVKGLSKVKATITSGKGKYGATIKSCKLTVGAVTIAEGDLIGNPKTSAYIPTSGTITVTATITDSRGFKNACVERIDVLDFTNPSLDLLTSSTTYFTGTMTYKYTHPNSAFRSRCVVTVGETTIKTISLGQKSAGQNTATLTFSESELSAIYNKFPSSSKGTLRFTFKSYVDSGYTNQIGDTTYKEITLSIPDIDATKPTATLTLTPVTSLSSPFDTIYVKGKSKVSAALTSGVGKYGATIVSYTVSLGGENVPSPRTSTWLINSGTVTITGTVTDSRGFSRTYTKEITVIDYSPPQILPVSGESEVIAARCDSSGTPSDTGNHLIIKAKRNYSKVTSNSVQKNYCAIQYRYKESSGSYSSWTTILDKTATSDEIVTEALLGTLDIAKSYFVQIRAIDDTGESVLYATTISTEKVYWHRAGSMNSFGFGKYAEEENVFDVAEEITAEFRGKVRFSGEKWVSLPLGTNVAASSVNSGRWGGSGVYYRVCAGEKHVYVAFNVSFTTSSSTVRAESYTIPYPPNYDVYALCPVGFADGSRGIATVSVSPKGRVNIYAVHKLPGATLSTGESVTWIDGYIDYWT